MDSIQASIPWIFDGIGTSIVTAIIGIVVGGGVGYKIGVKNGIKQIQKGGDGAVQSQIGQINNGR